MGHVKPELLKLKSKYFDDECEIDTDFLLELARTQLRRTVTHQKTKALSYSFDRTYHREITEGTFKCKKSAFDNVEHGLVRSYRVNTVNTHRSLGAKYQKQKPYIFKTINVNKFDININNCYFNQSASDLGDTVKTDYQKQSTKSNARHAMDPLKRIGKYTFNAIDLSGHKINVCSTGIDNYYENKYNKAMGIKHQQNSTFNIK